MGISPIFGPVVLGWALGSNDAANVFGTAVASRMVSRRLAIAVTASMVIVGAIVGGYPAMGTIGGLTGQTAASALLTTLSAAATILLINRLRLPASASQAVVGATVGSALLRGVPIAEATLGKIVLVWVGTPIGAALVAILLHRVGAKLLRAWGPNLVWWSVVIQYSLVAAGAYGAYALGANNVANVVGAFAGVEPFADRHFLLALAGGMSIALGVLAFSREVMDTVGRRLVAMDGFSALVAVLAQALTVHIYALLGVPVSSAQAIVGAVLGIGLARGVRTISFRTLGRVVLGWLVAPAFAGAVSFAAGYVFLQ